MRGICLSRRSLGRGHGLVLALRAPGSRASSDPTTFHSCLISASTYLSVKSRTFTSSPIRSSSTAATAASTPSTQPQTPHNGHQRILTEQLRSLMRSLINPVVVCTSSHRTPSGTLQPHALTMSSFTSLTLGADSPSLISFNIRSPSRTLDAIATSGVFNIHVLSGNTKGARIAEWFSRGNALVDVFQDLETCGCSVELGNPTERHQSASHAPILTGEGIRTVVQCRLLDSESHKGLVPVRDHVLVIGEVLGLLGPVSTADAGFGLAYADRRYRGAGEVIQEHVKGKEIDGET